MLFVGNALLDISVECDPSLLCEFKLTADESSLFEEWQLPLLDRVSNDEKAIITAGGSSQNSARIVSILLKERFSCSTRVYFMGCVGNDSFGKTLRQKVEESGITALYDINNHKATGVAVGLITSHHRTLIANLGAADTFHEKFIQTKDVQNAINDSAFIHIEGFFVCHSPIASLNFVKYCHSQKKIVSLGLSAKYVVDVYFESMSTLLPFCDIIFCNDGEAKTFHKKLNNCSNEETDLAIVATSLVKTKKIGTFSMAGSELKRVVFITSGPNAVTVAVLNADDTSSVTKYPVPKVEVKGDTIGAGDAFLGGVIAALSQQYSLESAVKFGIETGGKCCEFRGCTILNSK